MTKQEEIGILIRIGIIIASWALVYYGAPLWLVGRELHFIGAITSWRFWVGGILIIVAFRAREWLGNYEAKKELNT